MFHCSAYFAGASHTAPLRASACSACLVRAPCSNVNVIKAAAAGAGPAREATHVLTSAVYKPARSVLFAAGSTSADSDAKFSSSTTDADVIAFNDDLSVRRATSLSVGEKLDDVAVAITLNTARNLLVETQISIPQHPQR